MAADQRRWSRLTPGARTGEIDRLTAVKRIPFPGAADEVSAKDKNLLDQVEGELAFWLSHFLSRCSRSALAQVFRTSASISSARIRAISVSKIRVDPCPSVVELHL